MMGATAEGLVGLGVLALFSVAGNAASEALHLPVPGTVVGMLLLLAALAPAREVPRGLRRAADLLVSHLNLFYVPAAVAVTAYVPLLRHDGLAITVAVVLGTWAALAVAVLTFRAVAARLARETP